MIEKLVRKYINGILSYKDNGESIYVVTKNITCGICNLENLRKQIGASDIWVNMPHDKEEFGFTYEIKFYDKKGGLYV